MKLKSIGRAALVTGMSLGIAFGATACSRDYTVAYVYAVSGQNSTVSAYAVDYQSGALTQITGSPFTGTGRDPVDDFRIVMEELEGFSPDLVRKPMFVVASKVDVAQDRTRIEALRALAAEKQLPFYEISSVTGQGIEDLKYHLAQFLSKTVEEELKQD